MRVDRQQRTCVVRWMGKDRAAAAAAARAAGIGADDAAGIAAAIAAAPPTAEAEEELSMYEVAAHPLFTFRLGDVLLRLPPALAEGYRQLDLGEKLSSGRKGGGGTVSAKALTEVLQEAGGWMTQLAAAAAAGEGATPGAAAAADEPWTCSACTLINEDGRSTRCELCGTQRQFGGGGGEEEEEEGVAAADGSTTTTQTPQSGAAALQPQDARWVGQLVAMDPASGKLRVRSLDGSEELHADLRARARGAQGRGGLRCAWGYHAAVGADDQDLRRAQGAVAQP